MGKGKDVYSYGSNYVKRNNHRFAQAAGSALVAFGVFDDLSLVGIADNGFVALGAAVVTKMALNTSNGENDTALRKTVKAGLGIVVVGTMIDDVTGAMVADNPVAFACAATLAGMNINDWRKNRHES